ncbi:sensor histidine kinase [Candidatus Albibeggiatoa sp. nov. NOAA]|uniref:sensor histidine kinase n=1 Tax=Candidatus Albibeggiatoa sp. nov. NOAA TaxID=3162724 RepID=UPI0032FA00D7|nr:sensor histidine kinase [Thiotrichaceae bacterium]
MLLRTKILFVLAPFVILPLLGVGWIAFGKLKSTSENAVFRQMATLLNQVELHVDSHRNAALANIELFASSELLESYIFMPEYERYAVGLLSLMELFSNYNRSHPEYYEIRVLLLDGYEDIRFAPEDIPNITEDESETDYFQRIQANSKNIYFEYLLSPDINRTILMVSKPLYYVDPLLDSTAATKRKLRAYLVLSIHLDFIQQQIARIKIVDNGSLFLTNAEGTVIFGSNTFPTSFQLPAPLIQQAQHTKMSDPILSQVENQSFLFQAHKLDKNLILFTALPEQALLKEAYSLASIVIGILLLTTIVTVAFLFFVLDYLIVNPLHKLGVAMEHIESGKFDIQLNWHKNDEISCLAKQFETMVASLYETQQLRHKAQQELEQLNQELEQRIQRRTTQLEAANNDLVKLNQEKNEFLGIVAHDLKNPLQAIQGSAELISVMTSDPEILDFSHMIGVSSERMFDLITNLLDVNAIESGQIKVSLKDMDILPILQKVVTEYNKKAQQKNIQIHFDPDASEYSAYADANTIHQVLDNLVSNAVKYSPFDKQIYIRISHRIEKVRVEIQDEGAGISQEDQAKLFGKFTRLSTKPTGGEHSTGLGLFIVKKLVNTLSGDVWCESELGKGTCFIVELGATNLP